MATNPDQPSLECPECGARMTLRNSRFGLFYGCESYPRCRSTHGAHPDGRPLGKPATEAVRQARMAAHAAFDRLWQGGGMRRGQAYRWLTRAMGRTRQVHIGEMDATECAAVVRLVTAQLDTPAPPAGKETP